MRLHLLRRFLSCCLLVLLALDAQAQMLGDIVEARASVTALPAKTVGKQAEYVAVSDPIFQPFSGLAVEARAADRSLSASVRFRRGAVWGEWLPMRIVRSAVGDGLVAGYRSDHRIEAQRFEVRFVSEAQLSVDILGAGTFDGSRDEDALPAPEGLPPVPAASEGHIIPPPLITRETWGARPFIRGNPIPLASPSHEFMTFHHAAGFSGTTQSEGIAQVKAIQDLHQDVRGWSDIGYHFVIDRGGRLYQGRPFLDSATSLNDLPVFARGAHVGGANTGNIGICLLGCYHPPEGGHCAEEITEEALDTYVTLFAFLSERYGVPPSRIQGHRDFSSTASPRHNNYALLPDIRSRVTNLLQTGNALIAEATMTAETGDDGVVRLTWSFEADFGVVGYRLERWIGENRTVVAQGMGAAPNSFADDGVVTSEVVSYRLYVSATDGREQRVATAEISIARPSGHLLAEVFPNPTSGPVRIRYYLPTEGRVNLDVFDVTGRSVAGLVDAVQDGDSWYAAPLDTSALPGGVYFFRVQVEGFSGVVFDEARTLIVTR